MFEKLLEKILSRIMGEYVEGISKDQMKVGIWSGNVDISNLRIKSSVVSQLNVPFELKFGMIDNIKMKIPWQHLSSAPVVVNLKGLYLLLVPKDKQRWKELESDFLANRHKILTSYSKTLLDTITERINIKNIGEKDKGYFSKLVEKIIDNLQISISDIHIRMESASDPVENLGFGVTLDHLDMLTTDKNWKETFIDRTKSKGEATVYKKLDIKNFYVYWNADEYSFLSERCKTQEEYLLYMQSYIYKEETKNNDIIKKLNYLIDFSTEGKLKQTRLSPELVKQGVPEIELQIDLQRCNLGISRDQIKQVNKIINVVTEFSNYFKRKEKRYKNFILRPARFIRDGGTPAERKKLARAWWAYAIRCARSEVKAKLPWIILTPSLKEEYRQDFMQIFLMLMKQKDPTSLEDLTEEQKRRYENILATIDATQVMSWIEENLKKEKIQEEIEKAKKKKKGFFGGFFGSTEKEMSTDEQQEIEKFIEETFGQEDVTLVLPETYPKVKVTFRQNKFNLALRSKDIFETTKETVSVMAKDLNIDMYIRKNGNMVAVTLQNFKILYEKHDFNDALLTSQKVLFCDRIGNSFFALRLEDKPQDMPALDKYIELNMGSINYIHNKHMLKAVTDIFKFDTVNQDFTETLKQTTKLRLRQAKDIGETAITRFMEEQPKVLFSINMKTPQIILPLNLDENPKSPCWIFYPGNLSIKGDTSSVKKEDMYDQYSISLNDIKFVYCYNIQSALAKPKAVEAKHRESIMDFYHIFKGFNINVNILTLKKLYIDMNCVDARVKVNANLNELALNFTVEILNELKQITNVLLVEEKNAHKAEKKRIIEGAQRAGYLSVKHNEKVLPYYGALNNDVLHLFENPKSEEKAKKLISFRDIPDVAFHNVSKAIEIKVDSEVFVLEFDNSKSYNNWRNAIIESKDRQLRYKTEAEQGMIAANKAMRNKAEQTTKSTEELDQYTEIVNLEVSFGFENFLVNFAYDEIQYILSTKNFTIELSQTSKQLKASVELQNFTLYWKEDGREDYFITSFYEQSLASQILKSNYIQKQEKLIIITYTQVEGDAGSKIAEISFGSLFFDLEPNRVQKLLEILLAPASNADLSESESTIASVNSKEDSESKLGPKVLEIYQNSDHKLNDAASLPIDLEIRLNIQAINVLLINQIGDIPQCDMIVKDSFVGVTLKKGYVQVDAKFKDLDVYDLTNYPNTIATRDIQKIEPKKILKRFKDEHSDYLISVQFNSKDPQLFNIDSSLIANDLQVVVQNVEATYYQQQTMRIINFITEQLLPAVTSETDSSKQASMKEAVEKRRFDYLFKRQAYININMPFWTKMDIQIKKVQCKLFIDEDVYILGQLDSAAVTNQRWLNKKRLEHCVPSNQPFGIEGIWNDDYTVTLKGLALLLHTPNETKFLTSKVNLSIVVQLALFELEYEALFNPRTISNHNEKYMKTTVLDTTHKGFDDNFVYYDNAIWVDTDISSLLCIIGNNEYSAIMKGLDKAILYNDGCDSCYIVDFQRKEAEMKPSALAINLTMTNIALVTLDNNKNDSVVTKVFVENARFVMVSHPTRDSAMEFSVGDLRGYHLFEKNGKYYEKGFINDLSIEKVIEPKDNSELKELFIEDLLSDDTRRMRTESKEKKTCDLSFNMEQREQDRGMIVELSNLRVLVQPDVFLHLSSLVAIPDDTTQPKQEVANVASEKVANNPQIATKILILLTNNSFLIPSIDFEHCLVTKGDIVVDLKIIPPRCVDVINENEYQSITSKYKSNNQEDMIMETEDSDSNKNMVVKVKMSSFELFLVKFMDLFAYHIKNVPKRPILLPWNLDLEYEELSIKKLRDSNECPLQKVTIRKIKGLIDKFQFKFSVKDIELLVKIANYHLTLLTNESKSSQVTESIVESKVDAPQDKQPKVDEQLDVTYYYVSFNIENDIELTIINDIENLFVPTLICKINHFKFLADVESVTRAVLGFTLEVLYFNSSVFKWEPFVEKTALSFEYMETLDRETGIKGTNYKITNKRDSNLNINISIAFLEKVQFMLETYNMMLERHKEEQEKIRFEKVEQYLSLMHKDNIEAYVNDINTQQPESYISPIRIVNYTGYPINIQYYIKEVSVNADGTPSLRSIKKSQLTIDNESSQPLNIEESLEQYDLMKAELAQTFNYKFISVRFEHPEFTIDKISGLNIVQNYSKKIILKGKEKNLGDYKILFNAQNHNDLKEIMITSAVKFKNILSVPIVILIRHPFKPLKFTVEPDGEVFIPFDYVSFLFDMFVNSEKMMFKGKFESFSLKESGYCKVLATENSSFNFALKVFRDPQFYYLTKLVALPALTFKNILPVPIQLTLSNGKDKRQVSLDLEESISVSDFDITKNVNYTVKVPGFKASALEPLLETQHLKYNKNIQLQDIKGNSTTFSIVRLRDGYCHFNFGIYSEVVVINETSFNFLYRASQRKNKKNSEMLSGSVVDEELHTNKKITFLSSDKNFLEIKLLDDGYYSSPSYSNIISTQGIGSGVFQLGIQQKNAGSTFKQFMEIGYSLNITTIDHKDSIATKIVHLAPRTLLYNKTDFDLKVQFSFSDTSFDLGKGIKKPLYVYDYATKMTKHVNLSLLSGNTLFKTLSPIDLNQAGSSLFLLKSKEGSVKIFRIELLIQSNYIIATILDRTDKFDLNFRNQTPYTLRVYQKNYRSEHTIELAPDVDEKIAFVDPYKEKSFIVECIDKEALLGTIEVKTDKVAEVDHLIKKAKGADSNTTVTSNLKIINDSRYIEVSVKSDLERLNAKKQKRGVKKTVEDKYRTDFTNFDIEIHNFGVSLIAKYFNTRVEMFFLYMNNIKAVAILTEDQAEYQFAIGYLNIDNNHSPMCRFPLLLTTQVPLKNIKDSKCVNFHAILNNNQSENLMEVELLELELMPLVVTAEFSIYKVIMALQNQIFGVFKPKISSSYLGKYFRNPRNDLTVSQIEHTNITEWETIQFRTSNAWVYCKELKISHINIIMTFSMSNYAESSTKEYSEDVNVEVMIKALGITFLNIDESPLKITGLKLEGVFESQEGLSNILLTHIMDQNRKNIAKIVGSLDIIGNPVSLFSNVGNGVVQFFEKPVEGFVRGPVEGFVGIASGSGSLVKNTAAGAFNTVSKVTSSLASGLTSLSMDEKYLRQRNLARKNKPQHVFDGLGKGVQSLGRGIYSGVTGVITQPFKEIQKQGAKGIFKGLFKGVGGLITKPIGGMMDATSQTAEGLKKTITIFDDKANEMKYRIPRVFYGTARYFQTYNELDAKIIKNLATVANRRFENDTLLQTIRIKGMTEKDQTFIVITFEHFIIMKANLSTIEMYCDIKNISKLKCDDPKNLRITYFFEGNKYEFSINEKQSSIMKLINALNYARYFNFANLEQNLA